MYRIIRPRPCLRMMLDREHRQFNMLHSLFSAVIKILMRKLNLSFKAVYVNAIIVVL